jgi:hypothetical protein
MANISNEFTVERVSRHRDVEAEKHFHVDGFGHQRVFLNDGQPDVLNATRVSSGVEASLKGVVRMTPIKGSINWFSLRELGPKSKKRTFYVKGDVSIVLDNEDWTVEELYNA